MEIKIDDYNIKYKITGNAGSYVIILQGWGTKHELYDVIANSINGKYKVVQFDFPGFGGSDEPRQAWSVDEFTDFFIKFVQALGIKKATLIGHSFGGRVIIKLVNRANLPFEVDRIVLIDSAGIKPKKTLVQKIKILKYKVLKKFLNTGVAQKIAADRIEKWRGKQGSEDYRNASDIMKQCLVKAVNEDLTKLLPSIKQEVLLVWGELDTATPISDAHTMEELIKNSGLAEIKSAGHFCFLEQSAIFTRIMHSYFEIN